MIEILVGYLIGAGTTAAAALLMSRQRERLESQLSEEYAMRKHMESTTAYQVGMQEGRRSAEVELTRLRSRAADLERECDEMRERLDQTSAFAHSLATKGRSAILLRGTGNDH